MEDRTAIQRMPDALVAFLVVLAIALLVITGGDDERDLAAHSEWMAQQKEENAWVIW